MKGFPRTIVAGAATLLIFSGVAYAADFETMDADKDGKVTWEEYQKINPSMRKPGFEAMDFDKDGGVTAEELDRFRGKHAKEGGMGGSMGGKSMPPMGKGKPMVMPPNHPEGKGPAMKQGQGSGKMLITPPKQ